MVKKSELLSLIMDNMDNIGELDERITKLEKTVKKLEGKKKSEKISK